MGKQLQRWTATRNADINLVLNSLMIDTASALSHSSES